MRMTRNRFKYSQHSHAFVDWRHIMDFSPQITKYLSPKDLKTYKLSRNVIFAVFILVVAYFSLNFLFPSQIFIFDFQNPNSSKNTISDVRNNDKDLLEFYSSTPENFSEARITLKLDKKSSPITDGKIEVRKSYKAFFYPKGESANINNENLFSSINLFSFGDAVYVRNKEKIHPVGDAIVFSSFGFNWDDVVPISEEDLGAYEKGKLFTFSSRHPEGTVFFAKDTEKYYIIQDEKKFEISPDLAKSFRRRTPVLIQEKGLEEKSGCALSKNFWPFNSYSCKASIEELAKYLGKDYQFQMKNSDNLKIDTIKVSLSRNINIENLRFTLSTIKRRLLTEYGIAN